MQTLFSSLVRRLQKVYQKAEAFIEEERDFTLSQTFLNATLQRYVTNNVAFLDDLHADLYHDWLRLYATLHVKGLETTLSVDLKLIQMELNKEQQLLVFEQISNTQIIEAKYKNFWQKIAVKAAVFYYHKILKKDPLGMILEKFNVITVKDELLQNDYMKEFKNHMKFIEESENKKNYYNFQQRPLKHRAFCKIVSILGIDKCINIRNFLTMK